MLESDKNITILLVVAPGLMQEGLRVFLSAQPGIEIVGCADEEAAGMMLAERLRPQIIFVDCIPIQERGGRILRWVKKGEIPAHCLAMVGSPIEVGDALAAGAFSVLVKGFSNRDLHRALTKIRTVMTPVR